MNSTKELGPAEDFQPQYYIPYAQLPGPQPGVVVRTKGDALDAVPIVRSIMGSMDRDVPVYSLATMDELASTSVARERFNTLLFALFGGLALVLAAVGIYGVLAYSVSQATRQIGIRMALGAQRGDVLRWVIVQGMGPTLLGIGIGLAGAIALTRFLASLLYGINPTDPLTFVAVSLLLSGVAMLASYVPARRATKVDPIVALRCE